MDNQHKLISGIIAGVSLIVIFLFGFPGLRLFIGLAMFALPFYLFLGRFELEVVEKTIFSFFLAIGIIPTLIYPLAFVIGSIKATAIIVLILLLAIALLYKQLIK